MDCGVHMFVGVTVKRWKLNFRCWRIASNWMGQFGKLFWLWFLRSFSSVANWNRGKYLQEISWEVTLLVITPIESSDASFPPRCCTSAYNHHKHLIRRNYFTACQSSVSCTSSEWNNQNSPKVNITRVSDCFHRSIPTRWVCEWVSNRNNCQFILAHMKCRSKLQPPNNWIWTVGGHWTWLFWFRRNLRGKAYYIPKIIWKEFVRLLVRHNLQHFVDHKLYRWMGKSFHSSNRIQSVHKTENNIDFP